MDYIRFAIDNPVKVTVAVLLLMIFSIMALFQIPIQLVPNVDKPLITVETRWTGRSPQEVEREIIEEQEDKLKGVSGLKKMTATASQGRGQLSLEFFVGTNIDRALQEVSDKLREVPEYPDDVDQPVISAADIASENAIAWMILDSQDPDFDVQGFYDFADDRIKPLLERVDGLEQINIYGGREREVHIQIDPRKLAERGITYNQLAAALRNENVNISAGELAEGRLDWRVRSVGQYDNLDDIRQTVVAYTDGGPVRIKDLGTVVLTLEKRRSFVRANGSPALAINAIRQTGSNVIAVMDGLRGRIDQVNTDVLPQYENDRYKLRIRQVYDETNYIHDAVGLVINNLFIGGTLAGLSLLLFLRTLRPTIIVAFTIPISVIGTFIVMSAFGRNINVISLAGLAFAVGMVVDAAIVVLENIDRHLQMGQSPGHAAYNGAKEVWGAILASALTTLAVFIPVLTIQEEAGQLFRDISLAICAAVSLSLIVSVSVIPSASAHWLKKRTEPKGIKKATKLLFGLAPLLSWGVDRYADLIYWICALKPVQVFARIAIIAAFTIASILGAILLMPPTSYLPKGNQNLVFGVMLTPPAYNIKQNQSIGERIEQTVRPYWEADTIEEATKIGPIINFGTGQPYERVPPVDNFFFVTFGGNVFMGTASGSNEVVEPLAPLLTGAMSSIPGSFGFAQQASIFGRGLGGSNAIEVEMTGNELGRLRTSADALYQSLAGQYGFQNVRPTPMNFNLSGPELQIRPDYVRASELGINMSNLGPAVAALIDGAIVGDFRYEGESINLLLVRDPSFEVTPDTLSNVPLAYVDRQGNVGNVPLSTVTRIVEAAAPQQINRIEQQRSITFTVTPPDEIALEAASADIAQLVGRMREQGQITPDIGVDQAGTAADLVQVREAMLGKWTGFNLESIGGLLTSRIFLALVITYLLMAALFESFVYPFVIMFSVPLATVGGFMGLALMHWYDPRQQLDVLTMLGFVILIGIVVNNAILIVHQALNFMRGIGETESDTVKALAPRDAIRESVRTRIRPIFMTTLTSVLGMSPLVLMPGSGSELYKGLGSVVVGGLMISTLFTLIVVPLMFSLMMDLRAAVGKLFGAGQLMNPAGEVVSVDR
jgi:HAE1 family hydrophobic/amphiphilic exporter-1